jgi:hypothetical protein
VDSNSTNPDLFGAGWVQAPGQIPIGTPVPSLYATVPSGSVSANGLTIGNASSNATSRANADTVFLFNVIWNGCPNSQCPVYTSSGSPTTRGVSASADYAANVAIAVQNMNGTGLIGADSQNGSTSTNLSGVPITSGSTTAPGSIIGQNLHSLTSAENGAHTHANTLTDPGHSHSYTTYSLAFGVGTGAVDAVGGPTGGTTGSSTTGITLNNVSSGSGTPHNTVERSMVTYWNLKL